MSTSTSTPRDGVVFTWGVEGYDSLRPGSTTVEVLLTADGADTLVHLFHHNLPTDEFASHLQGWSTMLDRLAHLRS